jgi:hypothetical protein
LPGGGTAIAPSRMSHARLAFDIPAFDGPELRPCMLVTRRAWRVRIERYHPQEKNMNSPATEEQIRVLAYRLWEEAGSPDGRSGDFWVMAQEQLASEPGMADNTSDQPLAGEEASGPALS